MNAIFAINTLLFPVPSPSLITLFPDNYGFISLIELVFFELMLLLLLFLLVLLLLLLFTLTLLLFTNIIIIET